VRVKREYVRRSDLYLSHCNFTPKPVVSEL